MPHAEKVTSGLRENKPNIAKGRKTKQNKKQRIHQNQLTNFRRTRTFMNF